MITAKQYINVLITGLVLAAGLVTGCNLSPTAPGDINGKVVFQDDFKDPNSGWFVYKADDTKGGKYDDGAYSVWANVKSTIIALNPKTRQKFGHFTVEVDVKQTSVGRGTASGIIYRMNDLGIHYRFAVTDNQTFWIGLNKIGLEEQIHEEEFSEYIKPAGESNRLKVVCTAAEQQVYANGHKLATISDNISKIGELGMAFSNFGTPTAAYTFSNFKLWSIP